MLAQPTLMVLVVEPNLNLKMPYDHLPDTYIVRRVSTTEHALTQLSKFNPDVVFLSASLSPAKSLKFLEALKNFVRDRLIPLVIVVDLSHRLNFVPGTSWGGKIAVLDHFAPRSELSAVLDRVLKT